MILITPISIPAMISLNLEFTSLEFTRLSPPHKNVVMAMNITDTHSNNPTLIGKLMIWEEVTIMTEKPNMTNMDEETINTISIVWLTSLGTDAVKSELAEAFPGTNASLRKHPNVIGFDDLNQIIALIHMNFWLIFKLCISFRASGSLRNIFYLVYIIIVNACIIFIWIWNFLNKSSKKSASSSISQSALKLPNKYINFS